MSGLYHMSTNGNGNVDDITVGPAIGDAGWWVLKWNLIKCILIIGFNKWLSYVCPI